MSKELKDAMAFFLDVGATPVILYYGDTIWKKRWIGFELISLPGGREYRSDAVLEVPKLKVKRGGMVTQNRHGFASPGVGAVAGNLTEIGSIDVYANLKLIFKADPIVAGIAFVTKENNFVYWIDRSDVPDL